MPVELGPDIAIVSDFHMSAGYNRRTGTFDRNEDFFYDAAFSRFIDNLILRAKTESRQWRLLILGDFIDFLQVKIPLVDECGLTSSESTLAKLDVVARGHRVVFAALGRLLSAGHQLDLVIGNHDIEFIWPEVQARFKEHVAEHATAENCSERITFHPWIFYQPGMVYAEHGQQYDALNSFTTLIQPFLPAQPNLIELPLGSFFVLYLFNQIERLDPFADNVRPVTRYLMWALRTHPIVALSTLGYHVRFFIRVLRKISSLTTAEQKDRRATYRAALVRTHAEHIGLPPDLVEEIDRLSAIPALSNRWRQLEALLLRPLIPGIPLLAALMAIYRALKRLRPGLRSFLTLTGGIAALIWRERRMLRPATESGSYLLVAARQVHERLQQADVAVPAYVFGHTHTAEQYPLDDQEDGPRYYNTGTWTPLVPQAFDLLSTRERFTFVQITRDSVSQEVRPELLIWNDAAERAEPLPLLMS